MSVKKVCVIGAGTMGNGIAHVFGLYGYKVTLIDISDKALKKALDTIEKNLNRMLKKEKISDEQLKSTLENITTSTELRLASDADFVIEAATERKEIKFEIFRKLDEIVKSGVTIATNTSSISITEIAAQTKRPEKIVGMHFMNPVPMMKLVEVVRGQQSCDESVELVKGLAEALEKVPVEVNDYPGFISNRVLMPMINEAIYCLMEGVATREAIDTVMKLGMAHPMGPLTLADLIGLDVCLEILNVLYEGFGDPKYRPCPLLKRMVAAGLLGRKSGCGFYDYDK